MFRYCLQFLLVLLFLPCCGELYPQAAPAVGYLEVKGSLIGTRGKELERKAFYLFGGFIEDDAGKKALADTKKALLDRIKATEVTSRDCYFCQMQASPALMAWLKDWSCESPYCREITTDDIAKVPEFQKAYKKGLQKYPTKPAIAQKWLTTNLEPYILEGFYLHRRSLIKTLLGDIQPVQSTMTDGESVARFVDIPLKAGEDAEVFLISNVLPIEVGEKSYVWTCEVEIASNTSDPLILKIPVNNRPDKKCEVIVRDLPVCSAASCNQK